MKRILLLLLGGLCLPALLVPSAAQAQLQGPAQAPAPEFSQDLSQIRALSVRMLLSEIRRNPTALYLDGRQGQRKWNYTTGLELKAFQDVARRYDLPQVEAYVQAWADTMATEQGEVFSYKESNYNLDHICPARIYFDLYDRTGEKKYRRTLRTLRNQMDKQPQTASGEFWHKQIYPHQVWLDGLYMALPFYAEYTRRFGPSQDRDSLYAQIIHQFTEAARNTYDPATRLYRHAWDESRSMFWAHPQSGQSQHAWGRALGWYAMALVEVLDYIPEKQPGREELIKLLTHLVEVLPSWAQEESGMWYQVLDAPGREGNYLEATCSAMFTYAFLKGLRKGYIDPVHRPWIEGLYPKLVKAFVREEADGSLSLTSCCAVGGLGGAQKRMGDFAYYLSEPVIDNDPKGIGPFLWASLEYEALHNIDYFVPEPETRPAFPGAEGGGMYTVGGRGGTLYVVTSLEDSDAPGTLRHAVEAQGPRLVTFAVSGHIHLKKALEIRNPWISILGQTAPGEGITLRDRPVFIQTSQVIVRYLRFRLGSAARVQEDALGGRQCDHLVIDHCSMSWAVDECASFYANVNTTVSWCLIAESLNNSFHSKGSHGYGGIWGGRNVSFHHNLIMSHNSRNPRFDHPAIYGDQDLLYRRGTVEFVNNLVFNWGMKAAYGGEAGWFNLIGNIYKAGPASKQLDGRYLEVYTSPTTSLQEGAFYLQDNVYDVSAVKKGNAYGRRPEPEELARAQEMYKALSVPAPFPCRHALRPEPTARTYRKILREAGASHRRDAVDKRLVKEVKTGKPGHKGSVSGLPGLIDSEKDLE